MALSTENSQAAARPPRRRLANAIRFLALDAVEQAKSGHPGMPMGMADIAEVLWNDFLRFNPGNPFWHDRDRFVLSNGHGSMLLYSIACLTGYPLGIDELKRFRQLGSRTAGHPEREVEIGIETTTGPLGQGIANAVGMALAEKMLAARFNRPGHEIVDHHTYVFLGDGCMMEGISHEVCSLAGTLRLGKLIAIYDDNGISIDGETDGWFTDDTPRRFDAYGWHVVAGVEVNLGWEFPPFVVPDDILSAWDATERGAALEREWQAKLDAYGEAHPELAAEYLRRVDGALPAGFDDDCRALIAEIAAEAKDMATRKASERVLEGLAPRLPELVGGSADLTGSNNTRHSHSHNVTGADASGNYVHFGVREFGMTAILSGLSLHGGFIPYGGTFLVFSDYARNAIRMASLMRARAVYVHTHDSIGLGEDGPTHQPVEHLASLRAIPNLHVWRPCDAVETTVAWCAAVARTGGPCVLALSRQGLPHVERSNDQIELIGRGGYILSNGAAPPELVLIATGSEVSLALGAAAELEASGVATRVVSMPCVDVFAEQDADYRAHVLPPGTKRLVIEAGVSDGWWRYVGGRGDVVSMHGFGQSAPAEDLFAHYGFTVDNVVATARRIA